MRAVIQRVKEASVEISGAIKASIRQGLVIFIGIEDADNMEDIRWMSGKIVRLRIFGDENQQMNLSVLDVKGEIMVISQFTLFADTKRGNRPSYIKASKPEIAIPLYEQFLAQLTFDFGCEVKTGAFGADMKVALINDGPVTITMDTKNKEQ
jgi:D-tyrosyl-tRNA(Tyr) deacylase